MRRHVHPLLHVTVKSARILHGVKKHPLDTCKHEDKKLKIWLPVSLLTAGVILGQDISMNVHIDTLSLPNLD